MNMIPHLPYAHSFDPEGNKEIEQTVCHLRQKIEKENKKKDYGKLTDPHWSQTSQCMHAWL